jgi:hypothetical protein
MKQTSLLDPEPPEPPQRAVEPQQTPERPQEPPAYSSMWAGLLSDTARDERAHEALVDYVAGRR